MKFLPSSYLPSSLKTQVLWGSVLLVVPMWPFLDVSCPLIQLFPAFLKTRLVDFHVQDLAPDSKRLFRDVENIAPVITLYGHKTEKSVRKVIGEHPYNTVLFKEFLTTDLAMSMLDKFKALTDMKNYTLVKGEVTPHQRVGGLFSTPLYSAGNPWKDRQKMTDRRFWGGLDGIWNCSKKDTYGSFVPVGEGSMPKLINWTSRKYTPDTSFFGCFSKRAVTTPLHANWPADTLALQLAGRKTWLMVDPLDMKSVLLNQNSPLYAHGRGGIWYPNLKVDKYLQSKVKIATAEPGDMLYFPPYAAHAVVSDEGLNVMTALRLMRPTRPFKIHPWKTFQAMSHSVVYIASQAVRSYLGLNKYAAHFDISKQDMMEMGVQLKSWSPFYDDLQLETLLDQLPRRS